MRVSNSNLAYTNQRAAATRDRIQKEKIDNEKKQFKTKIERLKNKNKKDSLEIEIDYQSKIDNENMGLQKRLNQLRSKNALALQMEKDKVQQEVNNLKKTHAIQVDEVKKSQSSELRQMHEEHKEVLYNSRRKFEKEYAKYQL